MESEAITLQLDSFDAVIFDMDGTMIHNMEFHRKAWKEFAHRHGLSLTDEEFKEKFSGKKNDQIFQMIFGKELSSDEIAKYTEEKEAIYRELYEPYITEVEGLKQLIIELKAHHKKIAIATTAPQKNREFGLEKLGLQNKFEVIFGDEHVTHGKPDPEIYLETAKKLDVSPDRCIVFEDSPPGVEAGKRAGMRVVGILTTHSSEDLSKADFHTEDFTEIHLT